MEDFSVISEMVAGITLLFLSDCKVYSLKNHTSVWTYITCAGKGLRLLRHAVSVSLEKIISF